MKLAQVEAKLAACRTAQDDGQVTTIMWHDTDKMLTTHQFTECELNDPKMSD